MNSKFSIEKAKKFKENTHRKNSETKNFAV